MEKAVSHAGTRLQPRQTTTCRALLTDWGSAGSMEHGLGDMLYTTVTYYFFPTTWRDEVFKGMNLRNVNRELISRGILQAGSDGKAAQCMTLPGMPKGRAYVVRLGSSIN